MTRRQELSQRHWQIAELIAKKKLPDKLIAAELGISIETMRNHIKEAATRIPGDGKPRLRLALFFIGLETD